MRQTAPAWVSDAGTMHHTDASRVTLHVAPPTLTGTVSVALQLPDGVGGVWVDDVPVAQLVAQLGGQL